MGITMQSRYHDLREINRVSRQCEVAKESGGSLSALIKKIVTIKILFNFFKMIVL